MSLLLEKVTKIIVAGIFLYAGINKLKDPESFGVIIEAFGILPYSLVKPTSIILPLIEVSAGIGLIMDIKGSIETIMMLLGIFILILAYGIWMGLDIECGCFGPADPESRAYASLKPTLLRDLLICIPVIWLYLTSRKRKTQIQN